MALTIKWNKRVLKQLDQAIFYIETDSSVNAQRVRRDILLKVDSLLKHPESQGVDKYKLNNDGSFRPFKIHSYRVSYRYHKTKSA